MTFTRPRFFGRYYGPDPPAGCYYPYLLLWGPLMVAWERGLCGFRVYHGRWPQVGGHCWKLFLWRGGLAVWWNWRRPGELLAPAPENPDG